MLLVESTCMNVNIKSTNFHAEIVRSCERQENPLTGKGVGANTSSLNVVAKSMKTHCDLTSFPIVRLAHPVSNMKVQRFTSTSLTQNTTEDNSSAWFLVHLWRWLCRSCVDNSIEWPSQRLAERHVWLKRMAKSSLEPGTSRLHCSKRWSTWSLGKLLATREHVLGHHSGFDGQKSPETCSSLGRWLCMLSWPPSMLSSSPTVIVYRTTFDIGVSTILQCCGAHTCINNRTWRSFPWTSNWPFGKASYVNLIVQPNYQTYSFYPSWLKISPTRTCGPDCRSSTPNFSPLLSTRSSTRTTTTK